MPAGIRYDTPTGECFVNDPGFSGVGSDGLSEEATTVSGATMQLLGELGFDRIFGNPGSTELPMFRNLPSEMEYVLGLQEAVVVGMADGYAQASDRAAFVNLHSAAGVGNAMGNVFTAYRNQSPLVITAGQQARPLLNMEPYLFSERATELPRPYVKWASEPARAADVPAAILRGWNIAMHPPRGPVLISVPVDDWDQLCPRPPGIRETSRRIGPDPVLMARLGKALSNAERPVIVAGAGIALDGAWKETVALAERHRADVWMAPMSARCGFPESHPQFQGFLPARKEAIFERLTGYDLALVIGGPAFTYHADGTGDFIPAELELFQLGATPMAGSWTPSGTAITGHIGLGIKSLLTHSAPKRPRPRLRQPAVKPSDEQLTDRLVFSRLAAIRPTDSVIVEEAPSSRAAMHDHLPINDPQGFFTCSSGGLGHSLAAAVGISISRPNQRVIAIVGDGSAMYSVQALWNAAFRHDRNISIIILNNGRYEALNEFGIHFEIEKVPGTEIAGIDFCYLAQAFGLPAKSVGQPEDLDRALQWTLESSGPSLVEIFIK